MAQLRQGHASIYRRSGFWEPLAELPFPILDHVWYELKVEFNGRQINMDIDGQRVTSVVDAEYTHGQVGLRCAEGTEAYFDDFLVEEILSP